GWSKRRARRNYARLGVAAAVITSLGLAIREAQTWDDECLAYRRVAEWLARHGDPVATVMVADAPAYHYVSRGRVVAAVNADLDTSVAVARRFAVRYLILEPAHPLPWHDFYLGRIDHPALRPIATLGELRIYEIAG
ncbi:MAG TPA: hypothetical protein VHL09_15115, partial [Dehalococcoidia bacterium]|nr:hypothetical protein [Dehalococcoidia bacterium]